jgi:hypothetical protein
MSATAAAKGLAKKLFKSGSKAASKTKEAIKRGYKSAVKEGSKKTAKTTTKKGPISRKEFKKRGTKTGKGKYGTKGSAKGYAAYERSFGKTGKTTGKGTKGKGTAWYNKKYNPLGKGISAKSVVTAIPRGVVGAAKFAKNKPVDAIAYTVAGNWAGKKLGLWGNNKGKNTPAPKPEIKNYIPKTKPKKIKAYGGRTAPSMKSSGGLRYINGKWTR